MDRKWTSVIAIVVVVVVVVAGVGLYLYFRGAPASPGAKVLKVDQAEIPDSLDPDVTFSTPGWAAVQQVYQGLVNYNGSSYTSFSGVLAKNWSEFSNPATGFNSYTFHLRTGVHFSNGDPYNAYVQWYSFYRSLLLEQGPQFILEQNFYSTNFSPASPLTYYSNLTYDQAANATLVADLNGWNFDAPTASQVALMEQPNQSFQVLDNLTIQLNLGYGYLASNYTYLLATLSAPNSYAVDPKVVDANGGVVEGTPNTFLSTNTVGTGMYTMTGYNGVQGGGYTLTPDPNYWGAAAATAEPWNSLLKPANTTVQLIFQQSQAITINDLKTGAVQEASFAYIGPSTVQEVQGLSGVVAQQLPTVYGATSGSWWIYMNQNTPPFDNLSVRQAIAHAINYTQIVTQAFGGYATQWVGPVPPSYPYYNPQGLSPYPYDLALARAEIADSPCANNACAGTAIPYAYLSPGTDWSDTAQFLKADLAQIGITINPVPISLDQLYQEQALNATGVCTSATTLNGGPFPMGQEFYTSDYISPDDWTQNNAVSYGSANMCMSAYANATVDNLTFEAAASNDPAFLNASYGQMTSLMYNNYADIWLVAPDAFAVYSTHVHGFIQNPMASAEPFAFLFNTQWVD